MIAIIDYEAGNLTSVQRALRHLGKESVITRDPSDVVGAERIIFPGVGAAGKAMYDLKRLELDKALTEAYKKRTPILGICIGVQIVMEWSEENDTTCLGLVKGKVHRFSEALKEGNGRPLKVPHMGWNDIHMKRDHPVLSGIDPASEFYFVHAYYPAPSDSGQIIGETDYGITFASVIGDRNLIAVQFHLEKSGRPGLKILSNFCTWDGIYHAQ